MAFKPHRNVNRRVNPRKLQTPVSKIGLNGAAIPIVCMRNLDYTYLALTAQLLRGKCKHTEVVAVNRQGTKSRLSQLTHPFPSVSAPYHRSGQLRPRDAANGNTSSASPLSLRNTCGRVRVLDWCGRGTVESASPYLLSSEAPLAR